MTFRRGHGSFVRRGVTPPPDFLYTWYDSPEMVAQLAHFFAGAFVVLALSLHVSPLWPLGVGALAVAAKEFGVDSALPVAWGGEGDSWASSALDFAVYLAGGVAGWLAWLR